MSSLYLWKVVFRSEIGIRFHYYVLADTPELALEKADSELGPGSTAAFRSIELIADPKTLVL